MTLALPAWGPGEFATGTLEEPALSLAAWFGCAPAFEFACSEAGFDAGLFEPSLWSLSA